jgi:hypothetical protein
MKQILEQITAQTAANALPQTLKKHTSLWQWIQTETQQYNPTSSTEMVYIILHGAPPICECGNKCKFNSLNLGYRICCDLGLKCISSINAKMTGLKNHMMQHYGVANANDVPAIAEKRKQTMLERHGVEYAAQSATVQKKLSDSLQARTDEQRAQTRQKIRATNMERYGVENATKLPEIQQKVKNTNIEKYGVEYPLQIESVRKSMITGSENMTDETLDILLNKEKLAAVITDKSRPAVCELLGVNARTLWNYAKKYQIQHLFVAPYRSSFEQEINHFIRSNGHKPRSNVRGLIGPLELDLYIPEFKLAIECNGLYWHSEISADRGESYHYDKFKLCKERGIKLITIFGDDWENKQSSIEFRLRYLLHATTGMIETKKCTIKMVDHIEAIDFTDMYHLQGAVQTPINIGLYYDNNLVSLMSFDLSSTNKKYQYELIRFCSSSNIPGAELMLFNYFINKYDPKSIVSYSDNGWGYDDMYINLGFQYQSVTIRYQYTDYKHRYNQQQLQKILLNEQVDCSDLSDWQIMQNLGYDRVWDCGQSTWVWINNTIK